MGYAFISYSHTDLPHAKAIRQFLQLNGIQSWMAPDDIPAGSQYAQVINRAIKECSCVILLLSNMSQNSAWVGKEIERAINYRKVIIPIQIEDLELNDEFEFYLSTYQLVAIKEFESDSHELARVLSTVSIACGSTNYVARHEVQIHQTRPSEQKNEKPAMPINPDSARSNMGHMLDGMIFVVTGVLRHYSSRTTLKGEIEARGGKLAGSISGKTTALITNFPDSGTIKIIKAQELGIEVITEDEFISRYLK